ncbi:MAG: hypothetical protein HKM89_02720 [Gemmatimonadales bacterium]|nr:hypothetical protein [Gemmatimonadales bacterium]
MTSSTLSRLRALVVGLAFLFATGGRSVVDATLYHHDGDSLAGRVHVEAVDGNSCHAESCVLNALAVPFRTGSLAMDEFHVHALPGSGSFDQPATPARSSLRPLQTQPRAPPTRS